MKTNKPLYRQLSDYLKEEIVKAKIGEGEKLPSIRKMAQYLDVSKNTVESAYQQLLAEGYINNVPRVGYVIENLQLDISNEDETNNKYMNNADEVRSENRYKYDFAPRYIDASGFDINAWKKINNSVINNDFDKLLRYGDPQGEIELRNEISKFIYENRGIDCDPDRIIVGAGTQFCLSIICQMLMEDHKTMAMEDPGSNYVKSIFERHLFSLHPIDTDKNGLNVEQLKVSKSRVVFVTPSHQFPKGSIMSAKNRIELLNWAKECNGIIIEDDYDSGMLFLGKPIPALKSLDTNNNVVFVSSFSKIFTPSLRVAFMILPEGLMTIYLDRYKMFEQTVSVQTQLALAQFINEGYFQSHLRKLRKQFLNKQDAITKAIQTHSKENVKIVMNNTGMRVILKLETKCTEKEVIDLAANAGVKITNLSKYYIDDTKYKESGKVKVLLSYKGISLNDIDPAIELLSKAWQNALG